MPDDVTITVGSRDNSAADFATLKTRLEDIKKQIRKAGGSIDINTAAGRLQADKLRVALSQLDRKVKPEISLQGADRALLKLDEIDRAMERIQKKSIISRVAGKTPFLRLLPGIGGGAAGGAGKAAGAGSSGVMGFLASNPEAAIGAVGAALAALPFLAQAAATAITGGLGAAIAGVGILGATKFKAVQEQFKDLAKQANADLKTIGRPMVPVLENIMRTVASVMRTLTPVITSAMRIMAPAIKLLADDLLNAFKQPAVKQSIRAIAIAFANLADALGHNMPGIIRNLASGIAAVAKAAGNNPQAFASFILFLSKLAMWTLIGIAKLTDFAAYIEGHFSNAMHRVANIFDGVRHEVAHIWDQTWNNSIGTLIRFGHDVERDFNDFRHRTAVVFDGIRHEIAHVWDMIWNNTAGRAIRGGHDIEHAIDSLRHSIADAFDRIRHDISSAWDTIWNNTVGRVRRGVSDVVGFFKGLPRKVINALEGLGTDLYNFAKMALSKLLNGAKSMVHPITSFFSGFAHGIVSIFKKIWGWFSPSSVMYQGGRSLMEGLAKGIKEHAHKAQAAASAAAQGARGAGTSSLRGIPGGSGVSRWTGLVRKALSMEGLSQDLVGNVLYQMRTESGGNPRAINLTDINAQHGDPSRGLMQVIMSTFRAYHWPGTSWNIYDPLANIAAALNYARHRYGRTLERGGMGIGSGHGYALGTSSAAPGWSLVGERGPELAYFRGGERVAPLSGGRPSTVVLEIHAGQSDFDRFMVTWLQRAVRVKGGGDVQVAFGSRS